jgi:hypothetical protein
MDWYFRLGSTNSKVNEYQFNSLPIPSICESEDAPNLQSLIAARQWDALRNRLVASCAKPGTIPSGVAEVLATLSRYIQQIETERNLRSRSERAHLSPESQPVQNVIDEVLFRCYGLSPEEGEYITQRLTVML